LEITPRVFKFSSKLFEFSLMNALLFFEEKKVESNIDDKMKTGFDQFLVCMDSYLDLIKISEIDSAQTKVIIYGSVTLENSAIMRVNSSYHQNPWFSNISVVINSEELFEYVSDQGVYYGQVCI
jgi:hypothetical protein